MLAVMNDTLIKLFGEVAQRVTDAGVFDGVRVDAGRLNCKAAGSGAPAAYRLEAQQGRLWVSMVTPDRWLSGSIELDLLHTGDKLTDLIEEELVELDRPAKVTFEHFRSEDKLFTFRTPVPLELSELDRLAESEAERQAATKTMTAFLLAYEACFRNLGDMSASADDR